MNGNEHNQGLALVFRNTYSITAKWPFLEVSRIVHSRTDFSPDVYSIGACCPLIRSNRLLCGLRITESANIIDGLSAFVLHFMKCSVTIGLSIKYRIPA